MTIPTPPDPNVAETAKHLPHAITTYLREAEPGRKPNHADLLSAFAPDATVVDDDNTYTGHDEIRHWRDTAASEYTYTAELTHSEKLDDTHYVLIHHLEGNFPGGEVDLIYRFTLNPTGEIASLEIAP
jgi:aspartate/tyrosine/aromatic aminotransferase